MVVGGGDGGVEVGEGGAADGALGTEHDAGGGDGGEGGADGLDGLIDGAVDDDAVAVEAAEERTDAVLRSAMSRLMRQMREWK